MLILVMASTTWYRAFIYLQNKTIHVIKVACTYYISQKLAIIRPVKVNAFIILYESNLTVRFNAIGKILNF